jgi:hypothetical protein
MPEIIVVKPLQVKALEVEVLGTTPLVTHKWSEKAKAMMRKKHAGDKSKNREVRDPEQECKDATYFLSDGRWGVPAMSLKSAIIKAAHKDIGVPMTAVRKALFLYADDGDLIALDTPGPKMREDVVRVSNQATDLRYRPEYVEWGVTLRIEYDSEWLTAETIVNLIERAGFGIGIGENRPEKGGDWGRFEVRKQQ